MPKRWSEEIILSIILNRYKARKKLNSNYIQNQLRPLYLAACEYFGSWKEAIEASGLDYEAVRVSQRRRFWSKEKLLKIIQNRHQDNLPINSNYIQKNQKLVKLIGVANTYFGGWPQAVKAAGIDYESVRLKAKPKTWTRSSIVAAIRKRKREGKAINVASISKEDCGLYRATVFNFPRPGCRNAIIAAGFDPHELDPKLIWPKRRVQRAISYRWKKGLPLYAYWLKQHGKQKLVTAGRLRFGSWRKAIESVGLRYSKIRANKFKWWTRARIIGLIRHFVSQGKPLNSIYIQKHHHKLFGSAVVLFGAWGKAVEASGYDYLAHCKVWSSKAFVRSLTPKDVLEINKQASEMTKKRRRQ